MIMKKNSSKMRPTKERKEKCDNLDNCLKQHFKKGDNKRKK